MRTQKPISTISYNSEKWLKNKLKQLVEKKIIAFAAIIKHQPEDDEAGTKEHFHVYIEQSKLIQTVDFALLFHQHTKNNRIPKKCLPFQSSVFDHWYLYGLHDVAYLATKGQSRRYHYKAKDFWSTDKDYMLYKVKSIDMSKVNPNERMKDAIDSGLTFQEFFKRGCVPLQQLSNSMLAWELLKDIPYSTDRNGRNNHNPKYDE